MGSITIGVDIGQRVDPTAIAVVESTVQAHAGRMETVHTVRHLDRLPLGTPYPEVAQTIAGMVRELHQRAAKTAPVQQTVTINPHTGTGQIHQALQLPPIRLYVDATGVGTPVVDLLRVAGVAVIPVFFTYGDRRTVKENGEIALGKGWLVSRLKALLQTGMLKAPRTREAEALVQELLNYEIRVDQDANDKYGAFKVGTHDDLVTALGLAVQGDVGQPFSCAVGGERPQFRYRE